MTSFRDNPPVCETPGCERTDIMHSGTDAFMRGMQFPHMTGRFCYICANAYYTISGHIKLATINAEMHERFK